MERDGDFWAENLPLSTVYESPFSNPDCTELCSASAALISANDAGNGPVQTYDFDTGALVNQFVPDGEKAAQANGRGIAIHGTNIFYAALSADNGPSDSIHVCPYGTKGSGGPDIRTLPNPRPTAGIQDLAFHSNVLYALTGYPSDSPEVFELNPDTGDVIGGPISVGSPASDGSDGFTVLPNGNFLINDYDGADGAHVYREYDATTGQLVSGGLVVDLSDFGFTAGTGVALAPDGQSLYFMADSTTLVQTDLAGNLLSSQYIGGSAFYGEDIDVVVP